MPTRKALVTHFDIGNFSGAVKGGFHVHGAAEALLRRAENAVRGLCGHFHTYPKAASTILREMKGLGLVEVRGGTVRVLARQ